MKTIGQSMIVIGGIGFAFRDLGNVEVDLG